MKKLFLCSFASQDLKNSVKRFIKQSNETDFYKDVKIFGWNDLSTNKKKQINFKYKIKFFRLNFLMKSISSFNGRNMLNRKNI